MSSTNGTPDTDWPDVVAESSSTLFNSIMMYALPELHALAHNKSLAEGDADRILSYPLGAQAFLEIVEKNKDVIEKNFKPGDSELYGTALFLVKEEVENWPDGKEAVMTSQLMAFNDKNCDKELVYGILKCDVTKRVTVAFRGSATVKDLKIDCEGTIIEFDNPLDPDAKYIGVHDGFHDYLNGDLTATKEKRKKQQSKSLFGNNDNKYNEIMSELKTVFEKHPDYRLYVTGHSLGASLAQLFAMEAAASTNYDFLPKPVTTINFASPKVGDIYFRNCFEDLEQKGLLRCLRFFNDKDIIPTLPDRQNCSLLRNLRCQPSVFRHGGPSIALYPNGSFNVKYEQRDKETLLRFIGEAEVTKGHGVGFAALVPTLLRFSKQFLTYHSCNEYMNRFREFTKQGGTKVYLNDIYKNEAALMKLLESDFAKEPSNGDDD